MQQRACSESIFSSFSASSSACDWAVVSSSLRICRRIGLVRVTHGCRSPHIIPCLVVQHKIAIILGRERLHLKKLPSCNTLHARIHEICGRTRKLVPTFVHERASLKLRVHQRGQLAQLLLLLHMTLSAQNKRAACILRAAPDPRCPDTPRCSCAAWIESPGPACGWSAGMSDDTATESGTNIHNLRELLVAVLEILAVARRKLEQVQIAIEQRLLLGPLQVRIRHLLSCCAGQTCIGRDACKEAARVLR